MWRRMATARPVVGRTASARRSLGSVLDVDLGWPDDLLCPVDQPATSTRFYDSQHETATLPRRGVRVMAAHPRSL